ncbi:MAG: hypothetical protein WBF05_13355 [Anaerolineales bacterium]|jgi:hypothetical protein
MAEEEKKKKGFLDSLIDTFSSRDEKEAEEKAQKEAEEAKLKAMADKAAADKAASQKKAEAEKKAEAQQKAAAEAEKQAEAEEAKKRQLEAQRQAEREKEAKAKELERQEQIAARKAEAAQPKIITVHELTSDETLSHLSLKYYGHATKPYWMVIYEANIDVVGDNPNLVHRGMMIKIPELPPELQEKE